MPEIKNGGLDQYGAEPFEHQQFGTAGVEGVKITLVDCLHRCISYLEQVDRSRAVGHC